MSADVPAAGPTPGERTRIAAYALCEDADGRILLCHLAPSVGLGDLWTLPGGGIDFGESPERGALRELEEETGYRGVVERLIDVSDRLFGGSRGERMHAVRIVYRVRITGGSLRHEPDGSTDMCAWVTREDLPGMRLAELARRVLARTSGAADA